MLEFCEILKNYYWHHKIIWENFRIQLLYVRKCFCKLFKFKPKVLPKYGASIATITMTIAIYFSKYLLELSDPTYLRSFWFLAMTLHLMICQSNWLGKTNCYINHLIYHAVTSPGGIISFVCITQKFWFPILERFYGLRLSHLHTSDLLPTGPSHHFQFWKTKNIFIAKEKKWK